MIDNSRINIFEMEAYRNQPVPCHDRHYFKICILKPESNLHYANKTVRINQTALIFTNPLIPYVWEPISPLQLGYFCRFTEDFLDSNAKLQDSPLYKIGANTVYHLNESKAARIEDFFIQMKKELETNYTQKEALVRNYINLIMHEAHKMNPTTEQSISKNASTRITNLFIELLNRQFPILKPNAVLRLKTPKEFSKYLSVHVNHLNDSVKKVTGKSTSHHITEKITIEAKRMLENTNWNVSEIAFSLGFKYPNNFSKFFKTQTGKSPLAYRK